MSRGGWGKTEYTTGRAGSGWVDGIKKSLAIIFQLTFATVRPWQFKKSENINKIVINHFENEKKMWVGYVGWFEIRVKRKSYENNRTTLSLLGIQLCQGQQGILAFDKYIVISIAMYFWIKTQL